MKITSVDQLKSARSKSPVIADFCHGMIIQNTLPIYPCSHRIVLPIEVHLTAEGPLMKWQYNNSLVTGIADPPSDLARSTDVRPLALNAPPVQVSLAT